MELVNLKDVSNHNNGILCQFDDLFQAYNIACMTSEHSNINIDYVDGHYTSNENGFPVTLSDYTFDSWGGFRNIMKGDVKLVVFKTVKGEIQCINRGNDNITLTMYLLLQNSENYIKIVKGLKYAADYEPLHKIDSNIDLKEWIGTKLMEGGVEIVEFSMCEDFKSFIIGYRKRSNANYANGNPVPDKVWQEQWQIMGDKLVQTYTRKGSHQPQHIVRDHIKWDGQWELNKV